MNAPSRVSLRTVVAVLFGAFGVSALVHLAGGPQLLGDARPLVFGLLLLAWFAIELRAVGAREARPLLWCGLLAAVMLIGAGLGSLA
ncbi:MAG: hypothetical protein QOF04_3670 [Solirubrobacteraceae bacterium]|nr:hypothetical protein [Solirubrobacteraceae bacterium]